MYEIEYADSFAEDLNKLAKENRKYLAKIEQLIGSIKQNYKTGIGKPERLKGFEDQEIYSRRISKKHRLIYEFIETENKIILLHCYGHYDDK